MGLFEKSAPFPDEVDEGSVVFCIGRIPSPHFLVMRITKIWQRWRGTVHGIDLMTGKEVQLQMYMGDNLPQLDFWGFKDIAIVPPEEVDKLIASLQSW